MILDKFGERLDRPMQFQSFLAQTDKTRVTRIILLLAGAKELSSKLLLRSDRTMCH